MNDLGQKKYELNIFVLIFIYAIICLLIIFLADFWILRILTLPLFFFLLGFPLSFFILNIDAWERVFLSFGLSTILLLLIYYFQYVTDFYIGSIPSFTQYAIEVFVCFAIFISLLWVKKRHIFYQYKVNLLNLTSKIKIFLKKYGFLLIIVVIAAILRFSFLDCSDLTSDETFFVGASFPIINYSNSTGIPSPPWEFLSGHHPLIYFTQETITLNLLNTGSWIDIYDWMAKFLPALLGTFSVLIYYGIIKNIFNKWAAYIGALFLATATFPILISRVVYQEGLVIIFIGITFYFAYKERWCITAFFIGLSLLTKFSALTIIPPIFLYLLIRYLRLNFNKFKILLKNVSSFVIIILIMYLPIIIANIATYIEFGYADSFWSRIFGLSDPIVEAVGEAELPMGVQPGLLQFLPLHFMQLANVFGVISFGFIIFCVILAFFDRGKRLMFNLILIVFIIEYLLVFTFRWYQIITLSPLIAPFIILTAQFVRLIPNTTNKLHTNLKKFRKVRYKSIGVGIIIFIISFSAVYSWNTIAIDHSTTDFGDDYYETMNPAYYFSNLGYLWISRYGYDDVMDIIRNYSSYHIYIDDHHPSFSYIYYFYVRDIKSLISEWNFENNSLFITYQTSNHIWEPFEQPAEYPTYLLIKNYITINCTSIYNNSNFQIFITN